MSPHIAALLLPSLLILWQDGPAAAPPTAEQINRAVERLGDDSFAVRERASELLWRAGRAAEPALVKAAASEDPEVAARARRILSNFNYGIYPDTPEEVVQLVTKFRYGSQAAKQAALKQLIQMDQMPTLLKLLKTEPDADFRKQLTDGLVKDLDKISGRLFIGGDWAKVEQLLQLGAVHETGMRNYAAYLLLRGQLDAKISGLEDRARGAPVAADAQLLAHLRRAKGDLHGARKAAEKAADASLIRGILFELGDWQQLARLHDEAAEDPNGPYTGGIVYLGYAAAYHRLAGNSRQFEEAVTGIKKLAERKPNKLWYCGETLMINDRFQDAVDLLKEERRATAFQILCVQLRFRDALALAGIGDPRGPFWPAAKQLDDAEPESETVSTQRTERFAMGLQVASMLYRLGEKGEATGLFSRLAQAAKDDKDLSLRSVCEAEYKLGLREQAFEHAAVALSEGWNTSVLGILFPKHEDTAGIWWKHFRGKYPAEQHQVTMGRLRKLLEPAGPEAPGPQDWMKLLEEAEPASQGLSPRSRGKWLTALGETCLARGKPRLARGYFEQAAEAAPSVASMVQVGDLLTEDAEWQKAAEWYLRAWEQDPAKPLALYLHGRALVAAGQESEGRKVIEAARLLPLGNAQTRCYFAEDLRQRGLTEEAVRQWEVMVRTGEFQSWGVNEAARQLGNIASGTDDLRAAAYWQWPLLRCLQTSTNALGVEGYLQLTHLIHRVRARGLLAAGKVDGALGEIRLSHAALPGETRLALELVPELEKLGRQADADELFAKVFRVNEQVCDDFPNSGTHHNNLAWLAARTGRQLDKALKHAQLAVGLAPQNPAYIDTLAEVHFRRGDRQKAVELARRCIELASREEHFRRQLERFEAP